MITRTVMLCADDSSAIPYKVVPRAVARFNRARPVPGSGHRAGKYRVEGSDEPTCRGRAACARRCKSQTWTAPEFESPSHAPTQVVPLHPGTAVPGSACVNPGRRAAGQKICVGHRPIAEI